MELLIAPPPHLGTPWGGLVTLLERPVPGLGRSLACLGGFPASLGPQLRLLALNLAIFIDFLVIWERFRDVKSMILDFKIKFERTRRRQEATKRKYQTIMKNLWVFILIGFGGVKNG